MEAIRNFREKAALTQEELAERSGFSRSTIINYESGKRSPRLEDLKMIAAALGCTVADLAGNPSVAPARRRRAAGASMRSAD